MITVDKFLADMLNEENVRQYYINETIKSPSNIQRKANDLFIKLAPILSEEEKAVFEELIKGLPSDDEICIKFYAPKVLLSK